MLIKYPTIKLQLSCSFIWEKTMALKQPDFCLIFISN